jgi:hypothetical protein
MFKYSMNKTVDLLAGYEANSSHKEQNQDNVNHQTGSMTTLFNEDLDNKIDNYIINGY